MMMMMMSFYSTLKCRALTKLLILTWFLAREASSLIFLPCLAASSRTDDCQVVLGLPGFRLPAGFHWIAILARYAGYFLNVWLIQPFTNFIDNWLLVCQNVKSSVAYHFRVVNTQNLSKTSVHKDLEALCNSLRNLPSLATIKQYWLHIWVELVI